MAIVGTIQCRNGGKVVIMDDAYREADAEALERRRAETALAILRIDRTVQRARLSEGEDSQ